MLKLLNLFKAYIILLFVVLLMFLQFNIFVLPLSIKSVIDFNQSLISFLWIQPEIFFTAGFILCCLLWYCFRPIALLQVIFKNSLNPIYNKKYQKVQLNLSNNNIWILHLSKRISKKIGIRTPQIIIDGTDKINAKVLPGLFHAPLLVLTQGLLDKLTPDEIEAVLAHEFAHIAMHDTYSMSVTDLIILLAVWLPVYVFHVVIDFVILFKWREKNIGFIISLIAVLFAYGFFALFFLNTLNRKYELRADRTAMTFVNMQSFLNALHRVHDAESNIPSSLDKYVETLPKIVQKFIYQVFLSHPSIPTRIRALQ